MGNKNWYGCRDYPITHWMELPKHPDPKHYSNLLDPISVEINRM